MRSERQSETSRINGAKSRSPKTPPSRAPSSMSAIDHAISDKTLTLTNESIYLFKHMLGAYFDLFQPANQMELDIVCDIAAARWRLRRIWRYQTAMIDVEMDNQAPEFEKRYQTYDEDMRGAAAFSALTRTYRLRGGNILNENKISQNEPETPDVSPLDAIKARPEISTEPEEPKPVGQVPDLPNAEETKIPKAS